MNSIHSPLKILLVEDNRTMSAVIQELSAHTQLAINITTTQTGKGAFEQLNSSEFDCVLLDYELPDCNACQLLKKLQTSLLLKSPIIILTGHTQDMLAKNLLSLGATDFITKSECSPEKLHRAITYAISRVEFRNLQVENEKAIIYKKLDSATAEADYLLKYDQLTKLPNRELFKTSVNQGIARARRHKLNVCLLYIDIDNFKSINDTFGHRTGDQALIAISQKLESTIRTNDALCRIGEDEFAIYLDFTQHENGAAIVAEKILKETKSPLHINGNELYISCSIGITYHSEFTGDSDTLIAHAQTAMLSVKKRGKNSYSYYSQEMTIKAKKRLFLENEMRLAIENDDFKMLYQPKVDAKTGIIVGAEALIRWVHHKEGVISPSDFIPISEKSDLILDLDKYILNKVISQISFWQRSGLDVPVISINIPSREFQRGDLVTGIQTVLQKYQVAGSKLEIEITERLLMDHCDDNIKILNKLKDLNIHVSVDDFGTGYSSLSYLVQLPCDALKIDKSFIDMLPQSKENSQIVEAIIMLAHKLGKIVVAEGVETEAQFRYLSALNCDQIQGYYFDKPLEAATFANKLVRVRNIKKLIAS
ncbi:EAL domain-containing protein [Shewanella sp. UCD-KL12]|uniref:two-component system response regulator n=1 Tax=Shewanella sp. UCD-KL12 TaxID=1917163 RepID=UPI000970B7E5|nr:EAL domain-containing protein [Shewanella sp. UCD-KL12]